MDLFDFSARLWMRAYPRRWRATYGADLLGTLADVAPERARMVPLREGLAVLRAGWALRWREHPRFWQWLGYRLFDRRLPDRYRYWVIDDLIGPLYEVRSMLVSLPLVFFAPTVSLYVMGPPPTNFFPFLTLWVVFLVLVFTALKIQPRRVWGKLVGGPYPTQILPLWRRVAARRVARAKS